MYHSSFWRWTFKSESASQNGLMWPSVTSPWCRSCSYSEVGGMEFNKNWFWNKSTSFAYLYPCWFSREFMIWYSAVFICFDEFTGKHSKETTNPCLCWEGDMRTNHKDHSEGMGRNGFRWSHSRQIEGLKENGSTGLAEKLKKRNILVKEEW